MLRVHFAYLGHESLPALPWDEHPAPNANADAAEQIPLLMGCMCSLASVHKEGLALGKMVLQRADQRVSTFLQSRGTLLGMLQAIKQTTQGAA